MINIKHFSISDSCYSFALRICSAWTCGNDIDTEGQFVWDHSNTTIGFYTTGPQIIPPNYIPTFRIVSTYIEMGNGMTDTVLILTIHLWKKYRNNSATFENTFILVKSLLYCMRVVKQPLLCKKEENNNYCVDWNRFLSKSQR